MKNLELDIAKQAGDIKQLNIVAVSDIHLSAIVAERRTAKLVDMINELEPDIVLIAGDIIDDNIDLPIERKLLEKFNDIRSTYGIIAITGNHEYIGGFRKADEYYSKQNITVLKDSVMKIADSFYIAGRLDNDSKRYSNINRKPVAELINGADKSLPIILLDHQPFRLDEAVKSKVDLQISGHTHHGQLWPFSYITKAMFELSWGYKKKEDTHFYVTSGYGTSGPPIRIGNSPEILNIKLNFSL